MLYTDNKLEDPASNQRMVGIFLCPPSASKSTSVSFSCTMRTSSLTLLSSQDPRYHLWWVWYQGHYHLSYLSADVDVFSSISCIGNLVISTEH